MRSSKAILTATLLASAVLLLMLPALLAAQETAKETAEEAAKKTALSRAHIIDSSTDRVPARTAFPEYPRIARRDRIEGDATVCFYIDKRGRIRKPRISHVTHPIFRRAALRAVRASNFEPIAPHQVLKTAKTCRTYRFRLEPIVAGNN